MPRSCLRALLVVVLAFGGAAAAGPAPPFAVGERLVYRIRLGPLVVGSARLELSALRSVADRRAYEIRYSACSNGLLDRIYPVRDRIISWADTDDFRSHRLCKRIQEGRFRERCDLRLDHRDGLATDQGLVVLEFPPGSHDVFSALLRLRASPLVPGSSVEIPVVLGAAASTLAVDVGPRCLVTVPAGSFTCLELTPHLGGQGPFVHEGPVRLELSEGARRLPVRIRVKVPVAGALVVELVAIE